MTAPPLNIVGVDLGLKVTGLALDAGTIGLKPRRTDNGYERHWRIATELVALILDTGAHLAVVEDYAPNSRGINATLAAGELGGLVRSLFTVRAIPYALVRPNTLKLYATGKGNADKPAMVDAAAQRLNIELTGTKVDDLADALWLADLGRWLYRRPAQGPHPDGAARLDLSLFASWPTPAELRSAEVERRYRGRATLDTLPYRTA